MLLNKNIIDDIDRIDGWLTKEEGLLLYKLAKRCKGDGVIAEIGSWKGKSTTWLGLGSLDSKKIKIYAIDPHTGSVEHQIHKEQIWTYEEFKQNLNKFGLNDVVIPIVDQSSTAVQKIHEDIELIFIDGNHELSAVKEDFMTYYPKIVDGGIIAFHDTIGWHGPKKIVNDYLFSGFLFKNVGFSGSITYGQKTSRNLFIDRLKNNYIFILKEIYEFLGRIKILHKYKKQGKIIFQKIQFNGYDR